MRRPPWMCGSVRGSAGRAVAGALLALAVQLSTAPGPRPAWGASEDRSTPAQVGPSRKGREIIAKLRRKKAAPRSAADGGGRAWMEGDATAVSATPGSWKIVYEAGPRGVAREGSIFLYVPRSWGWSPPQVADVTAPGFTEVTLLAAKGASVRSSTFGRVPALELDVTGRSLKEGDRVYFHYGAGAAGALADRFVERVPTFWIAVDGDGDGHPWLVRDPLIVDVAPGPAARLLLSLPATARPGDTVRLTVAVLDALANTDLPVKTDIELQHPVPGLSLPRKISLVPSDKGRKSVEIGVLEPGVYRLSATSSTGLPAESNPMVVDSSGPRVLWGDLQGHSALSDGTGTPEAYYLYARDVAALDVVALTDHDYHGWPQAEQLLDQNPEAWQEIVRQCRQLHQSGRFVTVLGFEWTSWQYGHRHVLYPGDEGEILSSLEARFDTPKELWRTLRGTGALTVTHHTAGGPVATDWSQEPDTDLEPVTEVASIHGSCEAPDAPKLIYNQVPGNFARDALDRGYRLGFVGGGDGHDGHPGLSHLVSPRGGGVTAILSEELSREAVFAALKARRVYATNGPRIFLRTDLSGHPMGSALPAEHPETDAAGDAGEGSPYILAVEVEAPGRLQKVDLIRSGAVIESIPCQGEVSFSAQRSVESLAPGEYLYVRVIQEDGGAAWSSPFFFD